MLNDAISLESRNQKMISQVNFFTQFKDGTKQEVVMILDDGKLVVNECDMVDKTCPKPRLVLELSCADKLDDPAASVVSIDENIKAIKDEAPIPIEDKPDTPFKFNLNECLEVITLEDGKKPTDEKTRGKYDFCLN